MRRMLSLLALLLTACTTMDDHQRVEGWPPLEVVEHYVPRAEMQERCVQYVGFGMSPEACAEFDLAARKCHVWLSSESPVPGFIRKHERLHCAGYDHVGSTQMQRYLHQYVLQNPGSAAAGSSR